MSEQREQSIVVCTTAWMKGSNLSRSKGHRRTQHMQIKGLPNRRETCDNEEMINEWTVNGHI
jgi:hypothetical protein